MASGLPYKPKPITDIFTHDTDIDRRKCKRTVPMRVLCLGAGRTGTSSLRVALRELGYKECYHMMCASAENPPDCLMWQDAFAAKFDKTGTLKFGREEWDALLGDCQAVCDWPAIAFAKELIEAYPEAKVILSDRNVDTWHESTMRTVNWRVHDPELKWLSQHDWASNLYYPMLRTFWDTFYNGDFEKYGKQRYREHYEEVRSLVPKERLLEYRVDQGWEPLCRFLDHDVPNDTPFPQENESSTFVETKRIRNHAQMMNVAFRYLMLSVPVAVTAISASLFISRFGVSSLASLVA